MKSREKIAWLLVLVFVATVIDILVITQGWMFWGYHLIGWTLAWGVCLFITRSFLLSLASVMVISVLEDALFILMAHCFQGISIYPFYCHEWMKEAFGGWARFLGLNWWGIPSSYIILPLIALMLYLVNKRRGK